MVILVKDYFFQVGDNLILFANQDVSKDPGIQCPIGIFNNSSVDHNKRTIKVKGVVRLSIIIDGEDAYVYYPT